MNYLSGILAVFLFVGGGDPRKNLNVVPEALEKAGLKTPLVVVGWSGWSDSGQD